MKWISKQKQAQTYDYWFLGSRKEAKCIFLGAASTSLLVTIEMHVNQEHTPMGFQFVLRGLVSEGEMVEVWSYTESGKIFFQSKVAEF